mgnify:CR=1
MQAINRAGNLKRITTHPNRTSRRLMALETQANKRSDVSRLAYLDFKGYEAKKERHKLRMRRVGG